VTSHIFLCSPKVSVHVVIFANRTADTVWHGGVAWDDNLEAHCKVNKTHFYQHPGLYNR